MLVGSSSGGPEVPERSDDLGRSDVSRPEPRRSARVRAVAVVSAAVVAGTVGTACSKASTPASSVATTAPTTSSPTTTRAAPSAASTTTTTAAGGRVAGARCGSSVLTAAPAGNSGGPGPLELTISFTSTASVPCTLDGYPGLQMRDASGGPIPTTVVRGGSYSFTSMPPAPVTLQPGASVRFNMGYTDVLVGTETSCPASASIDVTPPNAYHAIPLAVTIAPCNHGTIVVSPVYAETSSGG